MTPSQASDLDQTAAIVSLQLFNHLQSIFMPPAIGSWPKLILVRRMTHTDSDLPDWAFWILSCGLFVFDCTRNQENGQHREENLVLEEVAYCYTELPGYFSLCSHSLLYEDPGSHYRLGHRPTRSRQDREMRASLRKTRERAVCRKRGLTGAWVLLGLRRSRRRTSC